MTRSSSRLNRTNKTEHGDSVWGNFHDAGVAVHPNPFYEESKPASARFQSNSRGIISSQLSMKSIISKRHPIQPPDTFPMSFPAPVTPSKKSKCTYLHLSTSPSPTGTNVSDVSDLPTRSVPLLDLSSKSVPKKNKKKKGWKPLSGFGIPETRNLCDKCLSFTAKEKSSIVEDEGVAVKDQLFVAFEQIQKSANIDAESGYCVQKGKDLVDSDEISSHSLKLPDVSPIKQEEKTAKYKSSTERLKPIVLSNKERLSPDKALDCLKEYPNNSSGCSFHTSHAYIYHTSSVPEFSHFSSTRSATNTSPVLYPACTSATIAPKSNGYIGSRARFPSTQDQRITTPVESEKQEMGASFRSRTLRKLVEHMRKNVANSETQTRKDSIEMATNILAANALINLNSYRKRPDYFSNYSDLLSLNFRESNSENRKTFFDSNPITDHWQPVRKGKTKSHSPKKRLVP